MRVLVIGRHERIANGAKRIAMAYGHETDVVVHIDDQRSMLAENLYQLVLVHCGVSKTHRDEVGCDVRVEDFVFVDGLYRLFEKL